ncbi:MAG: DNA replication/repair protein RecF [Ruminococcus callidus]|uniref:DNA replication/repair protein RecF n=1 Tax=Ruminococcus callidus TaxID=40519 RepID=UPI0039A0BA04
MKLTALSVDGFKNLKGVSLIPDPSYNLILGENAQGKTNLLEAIWTLTGCRSFRGTRERDYLPFSGGNLQVEAKFQDARREQSVRLCMVSGTVPEKKIWCNDVPQKSSALFSVFHCVTFTPEDLSLVEGGPERRRTFLDLCSAQLHAPMLGLVRRYQLALQQRNAVLKQRLPEAQAAGLLEIWDRQLEQLGTEIAVQRGIYVRRLAEVCVPLYAQIARGRETVSLHYQSSVFGKDAQDTLPEMRTPELVQQYGEKMRQSRSSDLLLGHTASGAHRDDLLLAIDGKPAKEFGSQGQKKSLALALKLAQAEIYSKRRKESPVVLLDDVMGELDEARQAVVSTIVQEMQVFVTTCHPESLLSPKNGKRFLLKDGMLTGDVENRPETA